MRGFKIGNVVQIKDIPSIADSFKNQIGIVRDLITTSLAEYASVELKGFQETYGKDFFHFKLTSIELYKSKLYKYGI